MFGTQHFDKKPKSIVSNESKIFAANSLFSLISQLRFGTESIHVIIFTQELHRKTCAAMPSNVDVWKRCIFLG
jgi:hypothetical protein